MSIHIGANKGDIADKILLPGDPLRAQFIAENFLENVVKYNDVRGMLGFTGTYKGEKVSVQGTGMGIPSISIYVHELLNEFDVKKLIRVGTCGAFQDNVKVRDVILAMSASTDSNTNKNTFHGLDFAPSANFNLLKKAHDVVLQTKKNVHVGNVFTSDLFYDSNENFIPALRKHGSLAVEMETAALYTIAARYNAEALSILTVSDHLLTGELTSSEERQVTFKEMIDIALDTIIEG